MLTVGSSAPDFELTDHNLKRVRLSSLKGKLFWLFTLEHLLAYALRKCAPSETWWLDSTNLSNSLRNKRRYTFC